MKHMLLIAALLLPLPASAAVDDFARTKAAEQLVDLMNQLEPFDASIQASADAIVAPLISTMPCPATALPDVTKSLLGIVSYQNMRPYLVKTYAATFDFNELAVIRAFYQTSAGARLLKLSPQLKISMQEEAANMIGEKVPELQKTLAAHSKDAACPATEKQPAAEKTQ